VEKLLAMKNNLATTHVPGTWEEAGDTGATGVKFSSKAGR